MKVFVMPALMLGILTSAALADSQKTSTETLVKPPNAQILTDAQMDQIVGGQTGIGVGTAQSVGGIDLHQNLNALQAITSSSTLSPVGVTGHGTITAGQ